MPLAFGDIRSPHSEPIYPLQDSDTGKKKRSLDLRHFLSGVLFHTQFHAYKQKKEIIAFIEMLLAQDEFE